MAIQRYDVQPVFTVYFLGTVTCQFDNIRVRIRAFGRASVNRYVLIDSFLVGIMKSYENINSYIIIYRFGNTGDENNFKRRRVKRIPDAEDFNRKSNRCHRHFRFWAAARKRGQ